MKKIIQSFNRGGVLVSPVLDTVLTEPALTPTDIRSNTVRILYLSLLAVGNAIVISIITLGILQLVNIISSLFFYGYFSTEEAAPQDHRLGMMVIAVPVIGAVITALLIWLTGIVKSRHNTRWLLVLLQPLPAIISIGTGAPLGTEGPAMTAGGIWGIFTGNKLHITAADKRILVIAGAASGMAFLFGSPLAAVLLAIELLLIEYSLRSLAPVILACITGAALRYFLLGSDPVFTLPDIPAASGKLLLLYAVTGLMIGLIAILLNKGLRAFTKGFALLPVHPLWRPVAGAVAIGLTGYFAPEVLGAGYDHINNLLMGKVTLQMLFMLSVMKCIAWLFAAGSGMAGGSLTPLLTIGGATGLFIAFLLQLLLPDVPISYSVAALIGMAAMFAGAARAILTAIVFSMEITRHTDVLLPLICACTTAYLISFVLRKRTPSITYSVNNPLL